MIHDSQRAGYCIRKVASALRKKSEAVAGPLFRDMTLGAIGGGLIGGMTPAYGNTKAQLDENRGIHAVVGAGLGAGAGGLAHLIDYYRSQPKVAPSLTSPTKPVTPLDLKALENMSEEELEEALRRIAAEAPNK